MDFVSSDLFKPVFTTEQRLSRVYSTRSLSRLEAHYMIHKGFMPEGHLVSEEQMAKVRGIPCIIVHGRYDLICPVSLFTPRLSVIR